MKTEYFILVYVTGYFASYYLSRFIQRDYLKEGWEWNDVAKFAFISIVSWIWIACIALMYAVACLIAAYNRSKKVSSKPPRWL